MARKKIKKFLKKAGKAALLAGALYGGSKLLRGRKGNTLATAASENANIPNRRLNALKAMTTDRAYTGSGYDDPIMTGGVGVKHSPRRRWNQDQSMTDNNPFIYKKGGRVTGIAKRGFGRALMKGKK
jgi:hypothetical protein